MRSEQSHYEELAACQAKLDAILQQRHISWLGWLESLDIDARAVMAPGPVYEVVRQAWFTRNAEVERLKADQDDWRKGVELIAAAAGYRGPDLSCVGIAEHIMALLAK